MTGKSEASGQGSPRPLGGAQGPPSLHPETEDHAVSRMEPGRQQAQDVSRILYFLSVFNAVSLQNSASGSQG